MRWAVALAVAVSGTSRAQVPAGADVTSDGCVDLRDYAKLQREFTGPACGGPQALVEMVLVPGGGAGPGYDFLIGKYEVTTEQFAVFLNDAEGDGGETGRGSHLFFVEAGGHVGKPGDVLAGDRATLIVHAERANLLYNAIEPKGERYRVVPGYEKRPIQSVAWIAATKFCNWQTIVMGMGEDECCYIESDNRLQWRPRTISLHEWYGRDLNDEERLSLVEGCRGFRLPMDDAASAGNGPSAFNEWLKAAAFDPGAPDSSRVTPSGVTIPPLHWMYACGRDELTFYDANVKFRSWNGVPYGTARTPVGYYDGTNWLLYGLGETSDATTARGAYDMVGNVWELMQDRASMYDILVHYYAARGGGYYTDLYYADVTARSSEWEEWGSGDVGFRVLRVP